MKTITILTPYVALTILMTCYGCHTAPTSQPQDEAGLDDPLVIALLHKDYSSAEQLLANGHPVGGRSSFKQAPAYWAISEADMKALELLIRFGLDVNYEWGIQGGNLLTNAVQSGHLDQVRLLVEAGASVTRDSQYGRTPLYSAIIYGQKDIEDYLRSQGAQLSEWDLDSFRIIGINVD
jgi:hypothetical protein